MNSYSPNSVPQSRARITSWNSAAAAVIAGLLVVKAAAAAEHAVTLPVTSTNGLQLRVGLQPSDPPAVPAGAYVLSLGGRTLVTDRWTWSNEGSSTGRAAVLQDEVFSNRWDYARLDLTPLAGAGVTRWHRHLLFVAPDLFAVFDDAEFSAPTRATIQIGSAGPFRRDTRSGDFRLDTTESGATAHVFSPQERNFGLWQSNVLDDAVVFRASTTNLIRHCRVLTLVIPYAGKRGGTGFKLLESDSALGARVWRNGLPTLLAFRTSPPGSESNLASMPVPGPAAVNVFDPTPRRQRAGPRPVNPK